MKRESVLLPVALPSLSDKAAAQLIDLLQELLAGLENHYYAHLARHHQSEHERDGEDMNRPQPHSSDSTDPPF